MSLIIKDFNSINWFLKMGFGIMVYAMLKKWCRHCVHKGKNTPSCKDQQLSDFGHLF